VERLSAHVFILLLLSIIEFFPNPVNADENRLNFGIFPYADPNTLVRHQRPLKVYLEQTLRRPVLMITAPDFEHFMHRLGSEYDLILSAPHMARYAELSVGYQRIAMAVHQIRGLILAPADSDIERLGDLAGRRIAMAEPSALLHQMALRIFDAHQLRPGRELQLIDVITHNNAILALVHGAADAVMVPALLWSVLDDADRQRLKILHETQAVPGVMLMAHPRLSEREITTLRDAVRDFNQSPQGKDYFFPGGFIAVDEATMRRLDFYIQIWQ
jgi:phosphonate transport system substrate-binding protein